MMGQNNTTICIAETRKSDIIPVKLLLLSLSVHCPGVEVHVFVGEFIREIEYFVKKKNINAVVRGAPNHHNVPILEY